MIFVVGDDFEVTLVLSVKVVVPEVVVATIGGKLRVEALVEDVGIDEVVVVETVLDKHFVVTVVVVVVVFVDLVVVVVVIVDVVVVIISAFFVKSLGVGVVSIAVVFGLEVVLVVIFEEVS